MLMAQYDVDTHMEVMEEEHREAMAEKDAEIAEKSAVIAENKTEIARLSALVDKLQAARDD